MNVALFNLGAAVNSYGTTQRIIAGRDQQFSVVEDIEDANLRGETYYLGGSQEYRSEIFRMLKERHEYRVKIAKEIEELNSQGKTAQLTAVSRSEIGKIFHVLRDRHRKREMETSK